ncbi:MAG: hypothetical protein WA639_09240 [Candidatus Acidiferrum sp.]
MTVSPRVSILVEQMCPIPAVALAFRRWTAPLLYWLAGSPYQKAAKNIGHDLE